MDWLIFGLIAVTIFIVLLALFNTENFTIESGTEKVNAVIPHAVTDKQSFVDLWLNKVYLFSIYVSPTKTSDTGQLILANQNSIANYIASKLPPDQTLTVHNLFENDVITEMSVADAIVANNTDLVNSKLADWKNNTDSIINIMNRVPNIHDQFYQYLALSGTLIQQSFTKDSSISQTYNQLHDVAGDIAENIYDNI